MSFRAVVCRLGTGGIVLGAVVAAAALAVLPPNVRHAALADACPASGPPCPANAFLTLNVTAGGPTTSILVSGGSFLPGEAMSLYWDTPSKVVGSVTADGRGNFSNVKVKPFAGERPGTHSICASVTPQPCALFQLQGSPTPTPSSAATPSESPSPDISPSPSSTPTPIPIPVASTGGGLDLILKPPLVFLPLAGLVGLVGAIGWWLYSVFPRQQRSLTTASVVHRSARPAWGPASAGLPETHTAPADEPRPEWPAPPPATFWDQPREEPTASEEPPETDG